MKTDKRQFDTVLKRLIETEPQKRSEARTTRRTKEARKSSVRGARKG